jgi:signal transduction histidine kinase
VTGAHGDEQERLMLLVHEVRSPTAALAAIASAIAADGVDDAARRQLVGLARAACRAIERIVGEAALGPLHIQRVDVGGLLEAAAVSAGLAGAAVRLELDPDLREVDADPIRLRQALDNLLENAGAHAPPGTEVVVRARAESEWVLVTVADEGPGVPKADRARIFEPGERLDDQRPGLGLGLTVVRAVAEAHGGSVTVESPDRGAAFTISLPAGRIL